MAASARSMLNTGASAFALLAAIGWPIALHAGAAPSTLAVLAGVLCAALLARLLVSTAERAHKTIGLALAGGLIGLAVLGGDGTWLRWQPTLLNIALLAAFALSLVDGMPLIERVARARRMDVGEHSLGYLRVLTAVWAAFFAGASALSALAALAPGPWWRLWNGFGIYVSIGLLLVGERLFRIGFRARLRRDGRLPDG